MCVPDVCTKTWVRSSVFPPSFLRGQGGRESSPTRNCSDSPVPRLSLHGWGISLLVEGEFTLARRGSSSRLPSTVCRLLVCFVEFSRERGLAVLPGVSSETAERAERSKCCLVGLYLSHGPHPNLEVFLRPVVALVSLERTCYRGGFECPSAHTASVHTSPNRRKKMAGVLSLRSGFTVLSERRPPLP